MNEFQTPNAVRHDTGPLAEEIHHLLAVTAEATDEKITSARERVSNALEQARAEGLLLEKKARANLRVADETIRQHPYETILLALGIGTVVGCFLVRSR